MSYYPQPSQSGLAQQASLPYHMPPQVPPQQPFLHAPYQPPPPAQYIPTPYSQPQPQPQPQLGAPQAPIHSASGSRTLLVRSGGIPQSITQIVDSVTGQPSYAVLTPKRSRFSSEPHVVITSLPTNAEVGSIRFHSVMSENIDLRIHGHELTIKDNKWGGSSREMQSRASGEKLKWKDNKALKGGDVKCTDAGGQVVARVEIVTWKKVGKEGRVELGAGVAAGGALMDEIVVGGIAMAEFLSRRQADDAEVSSAVVQICTAIISS